MKSYLALLMGLSMGYQETRKRLRSRAKPCPNCQKMHRHNNSYCSAECCKAHRARASK